MVEQESGTRGQLLMLLKFKGSACVNEMAKELGITEMAIRRHLSTLERDGLIESKLVRQAMGRPVHLYSLTELSEDLFPKKYQHLALELLDELAQDEGEQRIAQLFERRKARLYGKYRKRLEGRPLEDKVAGLADLQNINGYMARWEKEGEGQYVLMEHNCPIAQVACAYQHACQCELALFRELLEAGVERTECIANGDKKCVYRISDPK